MRGWDVGMWGWGVGLWGWDVRLGNERDVGLGCGE